MNELGAMMDQAVAFASTDLEKRRVETWKTGIWDYMVEGRKDYIDAQRAKGMRDSNPQ
jgi:hypothetical protein